MLASSPDHPEEPARAQGANHSSSTSKSTAAEGHSIVASAVGEQLKILIREFEAKALFQCREIIDQTLGSLAKQAKTEQSNGTSMKPSRTTNSCMSKKTPVVHRSMFALEASIADSSPFKPSYARRKTRTFSDSSEGKTPERVAGNRSISCTPSGSLTREVGPSSSFHSGADVLGKRLSFREDIARSSKDSYGGMPLRELTSNLDASPHVRHPSLVLEEESDAPENKPPEEQPRTEAEEFSAQPATERQDGGEDQDENSEVRPATAQTFHFGFKSRSVKKPSFGRKDEAIDFDPVSPGMRTRSNCSCSTPRAGVANLNNLQESLNRKLTCQQTDASLESGERGVSEAELNETSEYDSDEEVGVRSPLLLKVLGILPSTWGSHSRDTVNLYHFGLTGLLTLGCIVENVMGLVSAQIDAGRDAVVLETSEVILSVGALLGLFALMPLKRNNNEMLGQRRSMLASYAHHLNFRLVWERSSMWAEVFAALLWISVSAERLASSFQWGAGRPSYVVLLQWLSFAFVRGVFVGNILCLLHLTNGLILIIDSYCCQLVYTDHENTTCNELTLEWNKLQALLRRGSAAMTPCMIVAQITVVASILTSGGWMLMNTHSIDVDMFLSLLCTSFGCMVLVAAHLFKASQVTSRCCRMPAFINSHCAEQNMLRAQLVEYTKNSAAGFYVFEVKLTGGAVIKMAYIIGLGSLTAITRFALLVKI